MSLDQPGWLKVLWVWVPHVLALKSVTRFFFANISNFNYNVNYQQLQRSTFWSPIGQPPPHQTMMATPYLLPCQSNLHQTAASSYPLTEAPLATIGPSAAQPHPSLPPPTSLTSSTQKIHRRRPSTPHSWPISLINHHSHPIIHV